MRRNAALAILFCLLLPSSSFLLTAQAPPLPDPDALFAAVRDNLARAGRLQDRFAYKERRTELHTNPFGRLGTGGTLVYEVIPNADGPGFTRRLLERDGKPVINGEVESIGQRRRDRAQSPSAIEDTASVLTFTLDRRVRLEGRSAFLVTFTPKRDARPQTRQGRMARSFNGKIWIDEETREVMRVEGTAIETISYGFGLIARLGEGTVVTLVRAPVEDGIWLPTSIGFKGEGRALLLRKLHVDFAINWFDYRRIAVRDNVQP
jgi:hypothetical protein